MALSHLKSLVFALLSSAAPVLAQGGLGDTTPPVFVTGPTVAPNANPAAPLTAELRVDTNEPTKVDVYVREGTRAWRLTPSLTFANSHVLPLVGFRPSLPHTIVVSVRDAAGNRTTSPTPLPFTAPALPANFPPLTVTTFVPSQMERGVTLTGLRWSSPTLPGIGTYCVYLDETGQVVWLYATPLGLRDVIRMRNGNMLINSGNRLAQEVDLFGNIVTQWWAARLGLTGAPAGAIAVDCDSFHHEFSELPNSEDADFLTLSTEKRVLSNYPSNVVDTTQTTPTADVVGDVLVEFRRDGTLVRELRVFDLLDPYRVGYGSLANQYNGLYGGSTYSWSHGNAASVDLTDNTWVISFRHQEAVVKVRRSDHSIVWIHGPHERWNAPWSQYLLTPIGAPFEWNFHQHGVHFEPNGNLSMFDNGNYRAVPPATTAPAASWYSRVARFHIDPVAMTTEQLWAHYGDQPFFSGQFGDADSLPETGNLLVTDGAKPLTPTSNVQYSRIFEVKPTSPSTIVFEVVVNSPLGPTNPYNWNVYRSQRYTGVYPRP